MSEDITVNGYDLKCVCTVIGIQTMIILEMLSNGDLHNYLLKLQPS